MILLPCFVGFRVAFKFWPQKNNYYNQRFSHYFHHFQLVSHHFTILITWLSMILPWFTMLLTVTPDFVTSCGTNRLRSEALNRLQGLLPIVAAKEVGVHRLDFMGLKYIKMGKFAEKGWKSGMSGGMKARIIPNYFRNHLDGHVFGHPGIFQFETRPNGEFWRGFLWKENVFLKVESHYHKCWWFTLFP